MAKVKWQTDVIDIPITSAVNRKICIPGNWKRMTGYRQELVERYLAIKDLSVKKTTKAGHQTVLNVLKKENFAQMEISKVKVSDAKLFLIKLQQEDGKSYSTIHISSGVY